MTVGTSRQRCARFGEGPRGLVAPNQTGNGRCTGSGEIPAPVTVSWTPLKLTDRSLVSFRIS